MLGILLIYFIGRHFYRLADEFNQNKWLFAILGIVSYYAGTLLFGLGVGIAAALTGNLQWADDSNSLLVGVMALPFGIGACALFYYILKRVWGKRNDNLGLDDDILDGDVVSGRDDY